MLDCDSNDGDKENAGADFLRNLNGEGWQQALIQWEQVLSQGNVLPHVDVLATILIERWDEIAKRAFPNSFRTSLELMISIVASAQRGKDIQGRLKLIAEGEAYSPGERHAAVLALGDLEDVNWFIVRLQSEKSRLVKAALISVLAQSGAYEEALFSVKRVQRENEVSGEPDGLLSEVISDFLLHFPNTALPPSGH